MLEVKDVWVHHDGAEALRDVSLGVEEGSIVSIIGANGAGKTSLLRTISGLHRASRGEVSFQGARIDQLAADKIVAMGIAHCPEGRKLFPLMSVDENIQMGAYLRKQLSEIERDRKAIWDSFPVLRQRLWQHAGTLSGGEQQMLAIARALMSKPKLLLLDEPSSGLAPLMVQELARVIRELTKGGVTVLLVEQNARLAFEVATYTYVLEIGRITLAGEPKEVASNAHVRKAYLGM